MPRLLGIEVTAAEARDLVATLVADAKPNALAAAAIIIKGLDRNLHAIELLREQRDAILFVLEDPPDGLVELRAVLARDHHRRLANSARGAMPT